MQLTKYKLGDLIAQRREKNQNYDVPIRGVSRDGFINAKQQEADTSIYNVFYKKDFVFNPARMELNSIALNLEFDKALCSSLYEVFYVKDESIVLPEFLNLHIKRDEFARHCEYIGSGSAREYCRFAHISEFNIELPPLSVQEEIVKADRLLKRKIALNNRLIKALEDTAQAIYHHTFVENIDPENLPEGWKIEYLYNIGKYTNGLACQNYECDGEDNIPVLKIRELSQGYADKGSNFVDKTFPKTHIVKYGDLVFSWSATLLVKFWASDDVALNQHLFKVTSDDYPLWFLYFGIKSHIPQWKNLISAKATSMGHIKIEDLQRAYIYIPPSEFLNEKDKEIKLFFNMLILTEKENLKLLRLKNLLLSKLS